jgi:phage tail-like protein
MAQANTLTYLHVNRDGHWPGFKRQGLTRRADGALELMPRPLLKGIVPQSIKESGAPSGPSGIAVAADGTVYFSDPAAQCIRQIVGCDGNVCLLPCSGNQGRQPGRSSTPRGLLLPKNRRGLFAADSRNHRIQVFDPDTGQLLAVLGQPDAGATNPGSAPGRLNTPWGLAADSENGIYVLDYGNARVQKWNAIGELVEDFWDNVRASHTLTRPVDVCAADVDDAIWVFVVEGSSPSQVFVFDANGNPVLGPGGKALSIGAGTLQSALGVAASGTTLYVGDNQARGILQFSFKEAPVWVSDARGFDGPIAALALDESGRLWVHAGTADPPLELCTNGAYAEKGYLWSESPIRADHPKVEWQRLRATLAPLPDNTHVECRVFTSDDLSKGPKVTAGSDDPLSDPKWRQSTHPPATDLDDIYVGCDPATYLWVGVQFSSDGVATPVLSQIRVQFDRDSYLADLPAIYRDELQCGDFLLRMLSLFESIYQDVEGEIQALPALFDAEATPESFLRWLAEWLGLELDDNWIPAKQRQILGHIFELYAQRGTAAGLRHILKLFAGVDAVIEEPILNAAWWALPSASEDTQNSILGFTTVLAPAQPQGAVVGTSAVLDQSHLTTVDEFGAPLFSDVAYQFSVLLYRGQVMCADVLPRVRALIEQEKPAHTTHQLCIVEPLMRVGYASRVGIDSVVGGPSRSLALGEARMLGEDTVLAGSMATRIGQSRLGESTRLG